MPQQALAHLKVLDLTHYAAGPYCTRLLAGLGAEVLKIERPGVGDGARRLGPFPGRVPHLEKSGLFLYLNAGKKGLTLNLKAPAGVEILKKLVAQADVLVENFAPRVMPSLGLAYETLRELNPSLVMVSISNFGQSGPYCDYKATEIVLQAMGGLMHLTGEPGREPLGAWGYQACYLAGAAASGVTLAALYGRDATGQGQHIEVSIMEAVASILEQATTVGAYSGAVRKRSGNRHHASHPMAVMPCQDGYMGVFVASEADWETFARFVGREELLNPKYADGPSRLRYADEIDAVLGPWLRERTREQLFHEAQAWRFPFAMVLGLDEVLEDPQHRARGFFSTIRHPAAGDITYPGAPFLMSQTPFQLARPAPRLGEHNEAIYGRRLGYSAKKLRQLRQSGII